MIVSGEKECAYCQFHFEWYDIVADEVIRSKYQAHTLPAQKQRVYYLNKVNEDKIPLNISVYCPKCDNINTFDVEENTNE